MDQLLLILAENQNIKNYESFGLKVSLLFCVHLKLQVGFPSHFWL